MTRSSFTTEYKEHTKAPTLSRRLEDRRTRSFDVHILKKMFPRSLRKTLKLAVTTTESNIQCTGVGKEFAIICFVK